MTTTKLFALHANATRMANAKLFALHANTVKQFHQFQFNVKKENYIKSKSQGEKVTRDRNEL